MEQVHSEIDNKRSIVKNLREDLTKAEISLMKKQGRQSELEDQLELAKGEVNQLTLELNKSTGEEMF